MASKMTDDQLIKMIKSFIGSIQQEEYTITLPDCSQEKIDSVIAEFNRKEESGLSGIALIDQKGIIIK